MNILSIDPEAPAVIETIASGQVANALALSPDGAYLYLSINPRGIIQRLRLDQRTVDQEITLGRDAGGNLLGATAIAVDKPSGYLIASLGIAASAGTISSSPAIGTTLAAYDGTRRLPNSITIPAQSLYRRSGDGALFASSVDRVIRLAVGPNGVAVSSFGRTTGAFSRESRPVWSDDLVVDQAGNVFDLDALRPLGRINVGSGCALYPEDRSRSVITAAGERNNLNDPVRIVRYSLDEFSPRAELAVTDSADFPIPCLFGLRVWRYGANGVAIAKGFGGSPGLLLFRTPELAAIAPAPLPEPTPATNGGLSLNVRTNGVAYDARRNLVWASVDGADKALGNKLIAVEAATGRIVHSLFVGPDPGEVVLAQDNSMIYVQLPSALSIAMVDPETRVLVRTFSIQAVPTPGAAGPGAWRLGPIAAGGSNSRRVLALLFPSDPLSTALSTLAVFQDGAPFGRPLESLNVDTFFGGLFPAEAGTIYGLNAFVLGSGHRKVTRLVVDDSGVRMVGQLPSVKAGLARVLRFSDGRTFTGDGEIWTPDLTRQLGLVAADQSYATYIVPVPMTDRGRLVVVHGSPLGSGSAVTEFELDTWRPVARLSLGASRVDGLDGVNAVRAGADSIGIRFPQELRILRLAELTPWPHASTDLIPVAPGVQRMRIPNLGLGTTAGRDRLLVTTASDAGQLGNSLLAVDPADGRLDSRIDAGSEPGMLTVSPNSPFAWVLLRGENRVARLRLDTQKRDLTLQPIVNRNPIVADSVTGMTPGPAGSVAISSTSGVIQLWDGEKPRPQAACNDPEAVGFLGGYVTTLVDEGATRLYVSNALGLARCSIGPDGLNWLSSTTRITTTLPMRLGRNLVFTLRGTVYDPERSRLESVYLSPNESARAVLPVPELDRVFYLTSRQLLAYDWSSKALVGRMNFPADGDFQADLVQLAGDRLAFRTPEDVYVIDINAIPAVSAQPVAQPVVPVIEGARVLPFQANDLVYDPENRILYASTPNSAGADGDSILSLNPDSGEVVSRVPVSLNPRLLALSSDRKQLFYSTGIVTGKGIDIGLSPVSEYLRSVDLPSVQLGPRFPQRQEHLYSFYSFLDLAAVNDARPNVVAIDSFTQQSAKGIANFGADSIKVFADGTSLPDQLGPRVAPCSVLAAGEPGRMYCSGEGRIFRLDVNRQGMTLHSSFPLLPARGVAGRIVYRDKLIYTATGQVLEGETGRTLHRLDAQGPVAVDDDFVYWLDQRNKPRLRLQKYRRTDMVFVSAREFEAPGDSGTRLVPCGNGRLAFTAGDYVVILNAEGR